ncbi:hypothetical protein AB1Y20_021655 [Prymnesium parvum]|uniref:MSP domain-containing protein n=1 Tax=Prymnesium parvum TaxID=97485 RepID=A0AB34JM55_PRYPA
MVSDVSWEPSTLSFAIAVNKVAVQTLHAVNHSSTTAYSYKVKTTNPKRYSVRPNVGVMWPGESARVLTMPLSEELANELLELPAEERRDRLGELWSGNEQKDAHVEKIRCHFSLDGTRSAPIPEEGPVAPYTPEPHDVPESLANTYTAAEESIVHGIPVPAATPEARAAHPRREATPPPSDLTGEVSRLLAAEREANAEHRRVMKLHLDRMNDVLKEQQAMTRTLQARVEAQQTAQRALQSELEKHRAPPPAPRGSSPLLFIALGAMAAFAAAAAFGFRMDGGAAAPPGPNREEL